MQRRWKRLLREYLNEMRELSGSIELQFVILPLHPQYWIALVWDCLRNGRSPFVIRTFHPRVDPKSHGECSPVLFKGKSIRRGLHLRDVQNPLQADL